MDDFTDTIIALIIYFLFLCVVGILLFGIFYFLAYRISNLLI